jgi:signal transduction histidine kinase
VAHEVPRSAAEMASNDRLRRLHDATAEITRSLDLEHRIRTAVAAARRLQSVEAAALMLQDRATDSLTIRAYEGLSDSYASRQRIPMERARAAYRGADVHIVLDLEQGALGDAELIRAEGLVRALAVPLVNNGELIGALIIYTKDPSRSFSEEDIEIAHILAGQMTIAVANSLLYDEAVGQRQLTREILEALGEGILIAWPDGRAELNPRAREILGLDPETNTLAKIRASMRPEGLASEGAGPADLPVDRALRGENVADEYSFVDPATGERREAFVTAAPVHVDGEIVAAVGTIHDLSGTRTAEREREQFLSIVSHELRTPLTPLKALAQLIRSRIRKSREGNTELDFDSLEKNLAAIERQVDRMNGLVNDLLSVSRAERGTLRMESGEVDLAAVVRDVVQRYVLATAEEGRHRFTVKAPESLRARGDLARIDQLLMNLVGNAVKYSPTGGEIRVSVSRHDGSAQITIADHGIGIPTEELSKLGHPFVRGAGRAASFAGMGVGLYVARLVAEAHAGALAIQSDGDGKGTTVRVTLPL